MSSLRTEQENLGQAWEAIEFLVGSRNRFHVLESVSERPRARDELRELTGASRVTLSRILSDLESQGWVRRDAEGYVSTRAGRFVASELGRLLENLDGLEHLGENVTWVRLDQFDFDLSHLRDADVIMPTWDDFSAQTRTLIELAYDCTAIRGIGTGLDPAFMKAVGDATLSGDLTVELVLLPAVIDAIRDDTDLRRVFSDLADSNDATVYRYEGTEPLMELGINETKASQEDVVMLCGEHDEGAPPGTLRSTDSAVWEWAESFFAARREESRRLGTAAFTV